MEHSPVTTNPLIIMMINMTVVFIVLVVLMYLIKLIHFVDPTKPKSTPAQESSDDEPLVAVKSSAVPVLAPEPEPVIEEGISPEVIAAISAAISAYGFSGQIKAVSIVNHENTAWRNSMRNAQGVMRNGRR